MKTFMKAVAVLIGLCWAGVSAAETEFKEHPGFVDIDAAAMVGGIQPNVEVFLDKPLLRVLAGAATDANPEIADLIGQLELIQVKIFEDLAGASIDLSTKVASLVGELKNEGWSQVVRVPEEGESVDVLMLSIEERIAGLAVFVVDSDEWVFVNIVGDIEPELFGKLLARLGPKALAGDIEVEDLGKALGFGQSDSESSEASDWDPSSQESNP